MQSEDRRAQILETAAQIIMTRGLSECTLEEIAVQAKTSKPLVYKYFANRDELLRDLMNREFEHIRGRDPALRPPARNIEEHYRTRMPLYFEYLRERGALLKALFNDPGVYKLLVREHRVQRADIEDNLVDMVMRAYRLPEHLARLGVRLTLYSPDHADGMLRRGEVATDVAAEFWMTFVLGGWLATAAHFAGKETPAPARPKTRTKFGVRREARVVQGDAIVGAPGHAKSAAGNEVMEPSAGARRKRQ